jgi:hypothetical protein
MYLENTSSRSNGLDNATSRSRSSHRFSTRALRVVLCDVPLAIMFACLLASLSAQHIYRTYYVPLMDGLEWFETSRQHTESTYYQRVCTEDDITTRSALDLIVPPDESPREASIRTQTHGMSIFPRVVSESNAKILRDYILERNAALHETDADFIGLIGQHHRWSFKFGADAPGAAAALRDIATHPKLRPTIDALIGDDASLVELTAITSSYGAQDQHFHQDNSLDSCQMDNARSFVSMYSLFIPLQDTTSAMGATDACAGTHYCYDDGLGKDVCSDPANNIRVVGTRGNYTEYTDSPEEDADKWKTGDAFLFDMPVVHRGPAHTDPSGEHRVMLILTLSPRPLGPGLDMRQLGLGTSYSNRWDMWGLSITDLEDADEAMKQPWRTLRTLGVYKRPSEGAWGWDMLTVAAARIGNEQFGYRDEEMTMLVEKINNHYSWPVRYVLAHYDDGAWWVWVEETLKKFITLCAGIYGAAFILVLGASWKSCGAVVARTLAINFILFLVFSSGLFQLWRSTWGSDLRAGKSQAKPFVDMDRLGTYDRSKGPTKMPVARDVLIGGARLNSPWMASHNRIADFHPGNVAWHTAISDLFETYHSYSHLPIFPQAILSSINDVIWSNNYGEFLLQNEAGDWIVLTDKDSLLQTRRLLVEKKYPVLQVINQEILFQISECRHGARRESSMSRRHCTKDLETIQRQLFGEEEPQSIIRATNSPSPRRMSFPLKEMTHSLAVAPKATEFPLKSNSRLYSGGDGIVAYKHREGYWLQGSITDVDPNGSYSVRFIDDFTHSGLSEGLLRRMHEGERTLVEGQAGEEPLEDGSTSILRLERCSARFTCKFYGKVETWECANLL